MGFKFEKLSVLVVEDTLPMQKLVSSVLGTLGVGRILTANNGDEGFEVFCYENPDILLVDWHMAPVDGIELIRKIRQDKASPNRVVPVIMMSGYSALTRVSKALDLGATQFLVKPFFSNDLARRIAYVINKPRDFIEIDGFFGPSRRRRPDDDYAGPLRRDDDKKL